MKFTFTLKNIDVDKINKLYNLNITSNLQTNETNLENTTKLSDLTLNNDEKEMHSFLENKDDKMIVTMIDYISLDKIPDKTDVKCFWCRHSFDCYPLGCPLKYVSSQLEKTYFSDITKDKYTIKENISRDKRNFFQKNINPKINILEREYYEVDGFFCSFNCCLAFINENKNDSLYKHSKNLLKKIYFDIFKIYPNNFHPSPSWRLLKDYGGKLSIEEFRKSFNKIEFVNMGLLRNSLKFRMCSLIFNEKNKL
jgi:hypothetical protein